MEARVAGGLLPGIGRTGWATDPAVVRTRDVDNVVSGALGASPEAGGWASGTEPGRLAATAGEWPDVALFYQQHHADLVRLALLLVGDRASPRMWCRTCSPGCAHAAGCWHKTALWPMSGATPADRHARWRGRRIPSPAKRLSRVRASLEPASGTGRARPGTVIGDDREVLGSPRWPGGHGCFHPGRLRGHLRRVPRATAAACAGRRSGTRWRWRNSAR
jgi:hypothetical protein